MSALPVIDPDDQDHHEWDFSDWLNGDTLDSATVAEASGLTASVETVQETTVTVLLSGGTHGEVASVTIEGVSANGRRKQKTQDFLVSEQ